MLHSKIECFLLSILSVVSSILLNYLYFSHRGGFFYSYSPYRRSAYFSLFFFVLVVIIPVTSCFSKSPDTSGFYKLKHYKSEKIVLSQGWKFHPGDNADWADPGFDDSQWQPIDPTQDIHYLTQLREAEIGWFRLNLDVDSSLLNVPLGMTLFQPGASEIYLNGEIIHRFGVVSKNREEEVLFNPNHTPYSLQFTGGNNQVLAVRYSFTKGNPYMNFLGIWGGNPTLMIRVMEMDVAIQSLLDVKTIVTSRLVGKATFLLILALLHLFFFITYPVKRVNLYYSLFTLSMALGYYLEHVFRFMPREGASYFVIGLISSVMFSQFMIWGVLAVYSHAREKPGPVFWFLVFCTLLFILSWKWPYEAGYYFFPFFILLGPLEAVRVSLLAVRKKIEGARIVFFGWLAFAVLITFFSLFFYGILPRFIYDQDISLDLAIFCVSITFSMVLAIEYAKTKKSLQASLLEVEVKRLEAEKMQELDKTKSDLFANISHEFRTPLTLITGMVEKLHEEDHSPHRKEEFGLIQRNADRLLQLINQLLDLSKLEAGHLQVERQAGEINTFLSRLAGSFESLFAGKEINFRSELPAEPVHMFFDPDKVEKVIANLLVNAFKFTAPGGKVIFRGSVLPEDENRAQLELMVEDTGIGIPEEIIPRIFNRFYQAEATAIRSYEGSGIGLALVKELVELQEGSISVSSKPGVGTTFWVRLPMQLVPVQKSPVPLHLAKGFHRIENSPASVLTEAVSESLSAAGEDQLPEILIVEDNADLRRFIAGSLTGAYRVLESENGRIAFELATKKIPDLIISDIMMPELDGVRLCEKLKTDERTSHIPVILLTARADTGSRMAGLETGADDYLTKPFKMEELHIRIRNLMETRRKLQERYSRSLILQPSEVAVSSMDEKFLEKAMLVLEANLSNCEFDVETFSREIGMSRAQLHRKLKALTDQSASGFIRTFRLIRAASLLEQHAGNISEVADAVGFSSLAYFTRCFKEHYGRKPSEYLSDINTGKSEISDPLL